MINKIACDHPGCLNHITHPCEGCGKIGENTLSAPIVDVIYGGQYGSEAKRLFIEYYVNKYKPDAIVSNFGPNSGGFVSDGSKWATFPMDFEGKIMLSAGSIIDIDRMEEEESRLEKTSRVIIHQNACIVTKSAIKDEEKQVRIGSTMTGTMEAVVNKMRRNPAGSNIAGDILSAYTCDNFEWFAELHSCKRILLVVPQGHSLSINFGQYPYCTSRNTSPQQGLADAGIPIQWVDRIIGIFRTFPIRVSNRYNDKGKMIGHSGPCYNDQKELTWEEVGVPPEMTSVSKKVRRVFTFSYDQFAESVAMNGCTDIFLNFMNYLPLTKREEIVKKLSNHATIKLSWLGYGPTIHDIASVKKMGPMDEIDGRAGCHPTMFEMGGKENV